MAALALAILLLTAGAAARATPIADLTRWSLDEGDIQALDVEWEVFDNVIEQPSTLSVRAANRLTRFPDRLRAPEPAALTERSFTNATYRTLLRLPTYRTDLALRIGHVNAAYRLYANGQLIAQSGEPGFADIEERPRTGIQVVRLPETPQIELVLQVSNHVYLAGGPTEVWRIGDARRLERDEDLRRAADLAQFSIAAILAVIFLIYWRIDPATSGHLWVALVSAGFAIYLAGVARLGLILVPGMADAWSIRMIDFGIFAIVGAHYALLRHLFPSEFPAWLQRVIRALCLPGMIACFLAPIPWLGLALLPFKAMIIGLVVFNFVSVTAAVRRRREGADLMAGGYGVATVFSLHDIAVSYGAFSGPDLAGIGLLIAISCYATIIARRGVDAAHAEARLLQELSVQNAELEARVALRTAELSRSEARLRVMTDNLPSIIFQVVVADDGSMRFTYLSQNIEAVIGLSNEALRADPDLVVERIMADDRPHFLDMVSSLGGGLSNAKRVVRVIAADGVRWFEISARRFVATDGSVLIEGLAHDLTEQKELEDALRKLATTDPLTGLLNRGHFTSVAEDLISRALRYNRPLSMLMIDADHFKRINDGWGHSAGDQVLIELGRLCRTTFRSVDVCGRLGGEEFGVLLPETEIAGAVGVAERLRQVVAGTPIPFEGETLRITISIGVATLGGTVLDLSGLFSSADKALYGAKGTGRNRVMVADTPETRAAP